MRYTGIIEDTNLNEPGKVEVNHYETGCRIVVRTGPHILLQCVLKDQLDKTSLEYQICFMLYQTGFFSCMPRTELTEVTT